MKIIYKGYAQRIKRIFYDDNTATDPDAIVVTIKDEAANCLTTDAEGEFNELDISSNTTATGEYFVEITPDTADQAGIYIIYWRVTFGTGDAAETITETDFIEIRAEDEIPVLEDNYVSLDSIRHLDQSLFELASVGDLLRNGERVSRIIDSQLDSRFTVPIAPRVDTGDYDRVLVDAATIMTAARICRKNGYAEQADEYQGQADKIIEHINDGRKRLGQEITTDEIGFQRPMPDPDNSSLSEDVELEIYSGSIYGGAYKQIYSVEITTGGAVGTAVFKVETIAGQACESNIITDDEWISVADTNGLVLRFFPRSATASLTATDKWTIEAVPVDTEITKTGTSTRRVKIHRF
jgi:hypothetical protein